MRSNGPLAQVYNMPVTVISRVALPALSLYLTLRTKNGDNQVIYPNPRRKLARSVDLSRISDIEPLVPRIISTFLSVSQLWTAQIRCHLDCILPVAFASLLPRHREGHMEPHGSASRTTRVLIKTEYGFVNSSFL
jgi:hypothetical protein